MKKSPLPNFAGKVVQVSLVGDNHGYAIANSRFEMQGDRLFLAGVVPPGGTSSNWSEGAIVAVAWDRVTDYLVFPSVEVYRKARESFQKHGRRKA
jgi:hypothetical protein